VYVNCACENRPGYESVYPYEEPNGSFETELSDKLTPADYRKIVEAYTQRELSYPSDILNAFIRVDAVLARQLKTSMIQGLPKRYFLRTMLWGPAEAVLLKTRDSEKGEVVFPTWSWARWQGSVCFRDSGSGGGDSLPPIQMAMQVNDQFVGNLVWFYYSDPEKGLHAVDEERLWFSAENKISDLLREEQSATYQTNLETWGRVPQQRPWDPMDEPAMRGAPGYFTGGRPWGHHNPGPVDTWKLDYPTESFRQAAVEMWRAFIQSPWEAEP
jgi:hypothetical protein